jgi:hypothetical protein
LQTRRAAAFRRGRPSRLLGFDHGQESDRRNGMIVSTQGSHARVRLHVPKLNAEVRRARRQVRAAGCKSDGIDRVGVPLQGAQVLAALVVPELT